MLNFFCQLCFSELLPFISSLLVSFLRFEEVIKCSAHEKKKFVLHQSISSSHQQPAPCCLEPKTVKPKDCSSCRRLILTARLRERGGPIPERGGWGHWERETLERWSTPKNRAEERDRVKETETEKLRLRKRVTVRETEKWSCERRMEDRQERRCRRHKYMEGPGRLCLAEWNRLTDWREEQ